MNFWDIIEGGRNKPGEINPEAALGLKRWNLALYKWNITNRRAKEDWKIPYENTPEWEEVRDIMNKLPYDDKKLDSLKVSLFNKVGLLGKKWRGDKPMTGLQGKPAAKKGTPKKITIKKAAAKKSTPKKITIKKSTKATPKTVIIKKAQPKPKTITIKKSTKATPKTVIIKKAAPKPKRRTIKIKK
jgi:hypothetical protein